jgi:hypothetical protein
MPISSSQRTETCSLNDIAVKQQSLTHSDIHAYGMFSKIVHSNSNIDRTYRTTIYIAIVINSENLIS